MEEKLETVVARHDEQIKQNCKDIIRLQDQTDLMYKIATSVEVMAQQFTTTNDKIDKIDVKLTNVEKDLSEVKVKNNEITEIKDDICGMKNDINKVKNKDDEIDAKKWREIVKYVVIFFVGSTLTLFAKQIGLI